MGAYGLLSRRTTEDTMPLNSAAAGKAAGVRWSLRVRDRLLGMILRCRSHALTMAAQVEELASPLAVVSPYRRTALLTT
jgi:hypothetical protein